MALASLLETAVLQREMRYLSIDVFLHFLRKQKLPGDQLIKSSNTKKEFRLYRLPVEYMIQKGKNEFAVDMQSLFRYAFAHRYHYNGCKLLTDDILKRVCESLESSLFESNPQSKPKTGMETDNSIECSNESGSQQDFNKNDFESGSRVNYVENISKGSKGTKPLGYTFSYLVQTTKLKPMCNESANGKDNGDDNVDGGDNDNDGDNVGIHDISDTHLQENKDFTLDAKGQVTSTVSFLGQADAVSIRQNQFKCAFCEKVFLWKSNLDVHIEKHHSKKSFFCDTCGKKISGEKKMIEHMRKHTGEKPFMCSVCGKAFHVKAGLASHMKTHTKEKPYKCTTCEKSFTFNISYVSHMRKHTGERPYSCSFCDKSYRWKIGRDLHMKTHTGEKEFLCTVCGKLLTTKPGLNIHMRTHTGERPYTCSVCGRAFNGPNGLGQHMRTHTGEKPYKCTVCDKSFRLSYTRTLHMFTHNGEKSYECCVCEKSFYTQRHLNQHKRTHTKPLWLPRFHSSI